MDRIRQGGLEARVAERPSDRAAALALRAQVFRGGQPDQDAFDAAATQVLIGDGDQVLATFRLRRFEESRAILTGYSAQVYDLARLAAQGGAMVELGRFCTRPGARHPDLVRLAWAMLARLVDRWGARFLFGCTSFPGTDPGAEDAALGLLANRALAPADWAPGRKAGEVFPLRGLAMPADPPAALARLPGLLRSYLTLGGRVSDHAVIDRDLGTFHLFTGLDLSAIPSARAARLRDLAR